jgi:hypothetical protein
MSQYQTGQAKVLDANRQRVVLEGGGVTGSLAAGDLFKFQGESGGFYAIGAIVDATTFDLTANYVGTKPFDTPADYEVTVDFTPKLGLPEAAAGDVDIRDIYTLAVRKLDDLLKGHLSVAGYTELLTADAVGNHTLGLRAKAAQTGMLLRLESSAAALLLGWTVAGEAIAPGSMGFAIDSDNDQADRVFTWRKDTTAPLTAGTELMSLAETGSLILPVVGGLHRFSGRVTLGDIAAVDADLTAKTGVSVPAVVYQGAPASHFVLALAASGGAVASGPVLGFFKTRSAAMDANTIVANNDVLAAIHGYGADGATYIEGAKIQFEVDGTPGTNDMPGRIVFSTTVDGAATPTERLRLTNAGMLLLNDTTNADMTLGLTLNQGANDNHILTLKSSDVAHPMTAIAEADTYGALLKADAAQGGLAIHSLRNIGNLSLRIRALLGAAAQTTKATTSVGLLTLDAAVTDGGTGITDVAADGNLLVVRNNTTTRFIFDADGDSHQDVGTAWTNFDDYDDPLLCKALAMHVSRPTDPLRVAFGAVMSRYDRTALERAGLVRFNADGHHFVNMSRLTMLNTSGLYQVFDRLETVRRQAEERDTLILERLWALEARDEEHVARIAALESENRRLEHELALPTGPTVE